MQALERKAGSLSLGIRIISRLCALAASRETQQSWAGVLDEQAPWTRSRQLQLTH